MKDFLVQFFSNFLATVCGGCVLYRFLHKKIKENLERREVKKMFRNLVGDLIFDYTLAQKITEDEKQYKETDTFTLGKYRTQGLTTFLYERPISKKEKFPYARLAGLIHKLEANNTLINLVFSLTQPASIIANKEKVLKEAKMIFPKILKLLNEIEKFHKESENRCATEK